MKKYNPFNWASSVVIARFLSPYFKNLDENNVNIGFWKGEITLKNLELNRDFLILGNNALDVEGSFIEEVKITIPWKSLQSQPINIQIKGVKICLSQEIKSHKNVSQKENMANELKKEALKNFDDLIGNNYKSDGEQSGGGYLTSLINSIGENITVKIEDVELMYIFHISNKEIVKLGLKMDSLEIAPCSKKKFDNSLSKEIHVRKIINFSKLAIYFDTYDESFLKRYQDDNTGGFQELARLHNYILNDTDIEIDIEVKLGEQLELKPNITISPIFFNFHQKQIKFLILFLEKFTELQSPGPKVRPTDKKTVAIWWKYIVRRIMEEENIESKVFNMSFNTYIHAEKYKLYYMKKILSSKGLTPEEEKFVEKFEEESALSHIIQYIMTNFNH